MTKHQLPVGQPVGGIVMQGVRVVGDNHKTCHECGRTITVSGGYFPDFATYAAHIKAAIDQHGADYFDDHPSLIAMVEQAIAERRDNT